MTNLNSNDLPITDPQGNDEEMLRKLLQETFEYFLKEVNPVTGLVADKTQPGSPASVSVTGIALTTYIIAVENKFLSREEAINLTLRILRFFYNSRQSRDKNATGYKGFYYHFLEMNTGERTWKSELSTIDTALFIAGALSAACYFTRENKEETEIRTLADALYRRINWQWALNKQSTLCHGWKPGSGFLKYRWQDDYSEAMIMYALALGSPTFPITAEGYNRWTESFRLTEVYNTSYLYAGPLFIHQFSHMWIDFRHIRDAFNRSCGFDYFENSRRATYIHRQYAIENKMGFKRYSEFCWGLTASDGPGKKVLKIDGKKIQFYNYIARGAPFGPDDGTVSPWAVVASLPFAPEIVLKTIRHAIERLHLKPGHLAGFDASFNPTYPVKTKNPNGWVSEWRFGLNQAPVIIMIANYQSELVWNLMKNCSYLANGLRTAGFSGGWL